MNYQTPTTSVAFGTKDQQCDHRAFGSSTNGIIPSLKRPDWILPICALAAVTAIIGTSDVAVLGAWAYQHYLTCASAALQPSLAPI
jgi:hypothetical protein